MNGSLILCPENPLSDFSDTSALEALLTELSLIAEGIAGEIAGNIMGGEEKRFYCGDNFVQLITFMGCSPHLVFEPPADGSDNFCHVKIQTSKQPVLFTGQQTAPPRCPSCRFRIADWKNDIDNWIKKPVTSQWQCPKCENLCSPVELDWRQSGGGAKTWVEITNIFPGEAVPVDLLMSKLKALSGENWRYFYLV